MNLRAVHKDDLPVFFEQQLDEDANHMAAFTAEDPTDKKAFLAHWDKILKNEAITARTIVHDDAVVGYVLSYVMFGELQVSYWIGKEFWGQGFASRALMAFLGVQTTRPLYGRAAADNAGSIRVLEKCGFVPHGQDRAFAHGRGEEIDEVILILR